jgi:cystathionine beta-lyase
MASQFDEIVDFRNSDSIKWDFAAERGMPADVLPLWVADMDFRSPQVVTDAVVAAAQRGIFGYSATKRDYFDAIAGWMLRRYGWEIEPEWLVKTSGVVVAFSAAVRGCTQPGDAVLVQPPVYHPMHSAVTLNDRKLVYNELQLIDGHYEIDFDDFERKIVDEQVRMFILCSPANPTGRAWTREELTRMGDICVRHGVIVVADEIHQDLVLPGHQHHVFASLKPEFSNLTITCTAPSKTFSVAGFYTSNTFIADAGLRALFNAELARSGMSGGNRLGYVACRVGYESGEPWLEECVQYLADNVAFVRDYLRAHIPQVKLVEPEATYLLWLDFRELGMSDDVLEKFLVQQAKLWLNMGYIFGPGGSGFARLNAACPRTMLAQALDQLRSALAG